jgi:hypothetical protein
LSDLPFFGTDMLSVDSIFRRIGFSRRKVRAGADRTGEYFHRIWFRWLHLSLGYLRWLVASFGGSTSVALYLR